MPLPSSEGQAQAASVHSQYSSSVSPFQAKTAAVLAAAMAAAAWSCVEKMLHEHQRTSAPSACSVSMSTPVWIVMCSEPAMRAPLKGCAWPNSARQLCFVWRESGRRGARRRREGQGSKIGEEGQRAAQAGARAARRRGPREAAGPGWAHARAACEWRARRRPARRMRCRDAGRRTIRPGISTSAMRSSLRPKSASEMSATL